MGILKYLKLFGLFKNINTAYKEEKGKERPAWLSRRFLGAVGALIGAALSIYFGIKIDPGLLEKISDNTEIIISAAFTLYGLIMLVVGALKPTKKEGADVPTQVGQV